MRKPAGRTRILLALFAGVPLSAAAIALDPLAAQAQETYAFVVRMGTDTLSVENVSRTPASLHVDLAGRSIGRLEYRASLGDDATIHELTLRAWPPGATPDGPPAQSARLTFEGDSVIVDLAGPAGQAVQRIASTAGAVPYLSPSFALVEQMVLRARRLGGDRVEVPVFLVQGGETLAATVTGAGTGAPTLVLAGVESSAEVDADGRLLAGAVPVQDLTFTRVGGGR